MTEKESDITKEEDILEKSAEAEVNIHVIGFDDPGHKILADQTGGLWFPLPQ